MGIVIKIIFGYRWERTYFVQSLDKEEAKEKAFKMFKQFTGSCSLPETLNEAEQDDGFVIDILAEVEQIVI